jgi:hypothetical protein
VPGDHNLCVGLLVRDDDESRGVEMKILDVWKVSSS